MRWAAVLLCLAGCFAEFPAGGGGADGEVNDAAFDAGRRWDGSGDRGAVPEDGDVRDGSLVGDRGVDGTAPDGSGLDRGTRDVSLDGGSLDGGVLDARPADVGSVDGGALDGRAMDAELLDAEPLDALPLDAELDAALPDAALEDARIDPPDAADAPDAGPLVFPPGSPFVNIDCGAEHCCVLRASGQAQCWGKDSHGQSRAPQDSRFVAISAGRDHTCALTDRLRVRCWGRADDGRLEGPEAVQFTLVKAGEKHSCGRLPDLTLMCWGRDDAVRVPPAGTVRRFDLSSTFGCVVTSVGDLECWGDGALDGHPLGRHSELSVGKGHACAIVAEQGHAVCWGDDSQGQSSPPDGPFVQLAAGEQFTCGREADGALRCWGSERDGVSLWVPPVGLSDVSAGWRHMCGIGLDAEVHCVGRDADGRLVPPALIE